VQVFRVQNPNAGTLAAQRAQLQVHHLTHRSVVHPRRAQRETRACSACKQKHGYLHVDRGFECCGRTLETHTRVPRAGVHGVTTWRVCVQDGSCALVALSTSYMSISVRG
jgi:hypothetical protein